jgi:hypothetical protein
VRKKEKLKKKDFFEPLLLSSVEEQNFFEGKRCEICSVFFFLFFGKDRGTLKFWRDLLTFTCF